MAANLLGSTFAMAFSPGFAAETSACTMFAPSSESYCDPLKRSPTETYWENINPVGLCSCRDGGKRFAEAYVTSTTRETEIGGCAVSMDVSEPAAR